MRDCTKALPPRRLDKDKGVEGTAKNLDNRPTSERSPVRGVPGNGRGYSRVKRCDVEQVAWRFMLMAVDRMFTVGIWHSAGTEAVEHPPRLNRNGN